MKWTTLPPLPQLKHLQSPLLGDTLNDGVFSLWKADVAGASAAQRDKLGDDIYNLCRVHDTVYGGLVNQLGSVL